MLSKAELADLAAKAARAEVCLGGGNSAVSLVHWHGRNLAVKIFGERADVEARMQREWEALELLHALNLDIAPRAIGIDIGQRILVQSWLEGAKPARRGEPRKLLPLLQKLDAASMLPHSGRVGPASDAIQDPDDLRQQTIERCTHLIEHPYCANEANLLLEACSAKAPMMDFGPIRPTLSPSDFGPHNLINDVQGLKLLDLEFFGWDDPHKLVADTILHPLISWSPGSVTNFAQAATSLYGLNEVRFSATLSLAKGKWASIALGRAAREYTAGNILEAKHALNLSRSFRIAFEGSRLPHSY